MSVGRTRTFCARVLFRSVQAEYAVGADLSLVASKNLLSSTIQGF